MRLGLVLAILLVGTAASARPYTVKQGDTLYSIARTHGVPLPRLLMLNKLTSDAIKPGQVLELPDAATAKAPVAPATKPAPVARSSGTAVVRAAYRRLGSAYRYGGNGPSAFDCSGFVRYVYGQMGVSLPRTSAEQYRVGRPVPRDGLLEGDLLFFATRGGSISHIGLYIGGNKMIHASTPRTGVIVSNITEPYYRARYVGARRVL